MKTTFRPSVNRLLHPLGAHLSRRSRFTALQEELEGLRRRISNDVFSSPVANFNHLATLSLTKRRQEHLASLNLPIAGRSVLEVGAGVGDHTSFFLDRGCTVLSTEARAENLDAFRRRWFEEWAYCKYLDRLEIAPLDLDNPPEEFARTFDIAYCYGVLYHLRDPRKAIEFMSSCCSSLLLIETVVEPAPEEGLGRGLENKSYVSESLHGHCCHPTRLWVMNRLREEFDFAYMPLTQPCHDDFPIDWTKPHPPGQAQRAVFIASRQRLDNPLLTDTVPELQSRGL